MQQVSDIITEKGEEFQSDEIHEIIHSVPAWIFRWGISAIILLLCSLIFLMAKISYPDKVIANLRINSINSPKPILSKRNSKITDLLVNEGSHVIVSQPLAYMESIANPREVEKLRKELKKLQLSLTDGNFYLRKLNVYSNLGEVQSSYEDFYQSFLEFKSTQHQGYYDESKILLEKDIDNLGIVSKQIIEQEKLQRLEMANSEEEYKSYQKLFKAKVISLNEFRLQENKYLLTKHPQYQSRTAIISNDVSINSKKKELLEVTRILTERKEKFLQALNKCITNLDQWIMDYVVTSPSEGKVIFAGPIQKNQNVKIGEELFTINSGSSSFFGELEIPQFNMGEVKVGSKALIKLKSYPYQEYGMIRGKVTFISDVVKNDSLFYGRISLDEFERGKYKTSRIILKNGMQAEVSIITKENTLLQKIYKNISEFIIHDKD